MPGKSHMKGQGQWCRPDTQTEERLMAVEKLEHAQKEPGLAENIRMDLLRDVRNVFQLHLSAVHKIGSVVLLSTTTTVKGWARPCC